jgi:hypothetical protein
MSYNEYYSKIQIPEEVYLAQRVQTNQVEQIPVFLCGIILCALFVNGTVAAILGLLWSILRIGYGYVYRDSVGMKHEHTMKRIGQCTIPAYFLAISINDVSSNPCTPIFDEIIAKKVLLEEQLTINTQRHQMHYYYY